MEGEIMTHSELNGIKLNDLQSYVEIIEDNPVQAMSQYGIVAHWRGGVNSEIRTMNQKIGGKEIKKDFSFNVGEPQELLGNNAHPTPQDYLLGGMAGCMLVGFVAKASQLGIKLEELDLTITGTLNLRGFLNVDPQVPVGFPEINFNFNVKGNGTQEQYDDIIASVQQFSPNYRTISDAVKVTSLVV